MNIACKQIINNLFKIDNEKEVIEKLKLAKTSIFSVEENKILLEMVYGELSPEIDCQSLIDDLSKELEHKINAKKMIDELFSMLEHRSDLSVIDIKNELFSQSLSHKNGAYYVIINSNPGKRFIIEVYDNIFYFFESEHPYKNNEPICEEDVVKYFPELIYAIDRIKKRPIARRRIFPLKAAPVYNMTYK